MNGNFFRLTNSVVDINETDAKNHLHELNLSRNIQLVMDYFTYLLFVDTSRLGNNEFSSQHQSIKDGILAIMNKRYDTGARQISNVIEGIVRESLFNDGCLDGKSPRAKWTGDIHEHQQPLNFFQLLEGALEDPRSRIGRTCGYLSREEIYHISEMIRNPLSHGAMQAAVLEDYKELFFILILLFHDIVNPHNYVYNDKYRSWIYRTKRNLRLSAEEPNLDRLLAIGAEQGLSEDEIRVNYPTVNP